MPNLALALYLETDELVKSCKELTDDLTCSENVEMFDRQQ